MDSLNDYYGDDVWLDEKQATEIRKYLLDNAADHSSQSRSRTFATGPEQVPHFLKSRIRAISSASIMKLPPDSFGAMRMWEVPVTAKPATAVPMPVSTTSIR